MADVTVPVAPALVTVPNVELAMIGQWKLGTGPATMTMTDFAEAVAAMDCPAVRNPPLKLGHDEPDPKGQMRWDGEPSIGWISNMATADNGGRLVGDYTGVPAWLADILPSAYPDRSVEARRNFLCQAGHVHPFVITAVALLGVVEPGIGMIKSLQDVAGLYQIAASQPEATGERIVVVFHSSQESTPMTTQIKAAVSSEDIRRAYYESSGNWNRYIAEMQMDPLQLILMDESDGKYYRVPVTIDGESIEFAEPVPVAVEYIDRPGDVAATVQRSVTLAASAEREFRAQIAATATTDPPSADPPADPQDPENATGQQPAGPGEGSAAPAAPEPPAPTEPVTPKVAASRIHGAPIKRKDHDVEFTDAQITRLREVLGLAESDELTPDMIIEASGKLAETKIAAGGPGTIVLDAEAYADMQKRIERGDQARQVQLDTERDRALDGAIRAGKFAPARRAQWERMWKADPKGTADVIASLTPGMVPTSEIGYPGDPEAYNDSEFDRLFGPGAAPARNGG